MEVTNWSDIPYEVKLLIKRQYKDYCEYVSKKRQYKDYCEYVSNPLTWKDWAKKQGYSVKQEELWITMQ